MNDMSLTTLESGSTTVSAPTLDILASQLRGRVLHGGDAAYDEARTIWNAMIDRRPGMILQCADAADVAQAVRFVRDFHLLVAVRGGGHNIAGNAVCDGGLVIDLSRMTIVLTGQDGVVEQARRQLEDLVPVWAVLDYTNAALVQRELLLAKINILGPEYFEELLAHHREITNPAEGVDAENAHEALDVPLSEVARDFHPSRLAASQALRHKHEHLRSITYFTHQFGGKVLDISTNSCIVEV